MKRIALSLASILFLVGTVNAQHVSEFTARDKTEIFIQHVVKFMNVEPSKYQAMVLEYEIGQALAEISKIDRESLGGDFIDNALSELHSEYAKASQLVQDGKDTEARQALRALAGNADPYLSSHSRLLLAEIDFRAGNYEAARERCEKLMAKDRARLIRDYRACELIAMSFAKEKKPLMEFAQIYLLLIDFEDLPKAVQSRAQKRANELQQVVGRPLNTVATWMNEVEKALTKKDTGEATQSQEGEIVSALDKLIELQEAKERQSCKNSGSCAGGACKNNGKPKGNRSKNHAKVSALPPAGEGRTVLRGVSRAGADSIWGQLRNKDASRALQSFSGKLPARYEKLLEQYYRDLSRER